MQPCETFDGTTGAKTWSNIQKMTQEINQVIRNRDPLIRLCLKARHFGDVRLWFPFGFSQFGSVFFYLKLKVSTDTFLCALKC